MVKEKLQSVRNLLDTALWERRPGAAPKGVERLETAIMRAIQGLDSALSEYTNEINSLQARIDSLMLEFCPVEMTAEQIEEWGKHQVPYDETLHRFTEQELVLPEDVLNDAKRYRWLRGCLVSDRTDKDDSIVECSTEEDIDAVIDIASSNTGVKQND